MSGLSEREMRILADIGSRSEHMAAAVVDWANINSGSDNLAGIADIRALLAARLEPLADRIEIRRADPITSMNEKGERCQILRGDNILARKRPEAARRIVLTGHMDTVFPRDHSFQTCRAVRAGIVNGPGTADMKGGLLILIEALHALEDHGLITDIGWDVVINSDEEVSSLGSASLLREVARTARVGMTFEPSLSPDGLFAGARKGSGNLVARVEGTPAHAGRNPGDGRNAVLAAADFAQQLDSWSKARDDVQTNVARILGGGPSNIVPALAMLWWNMRPASAEAQQDAEQAISGLRDRVETDHQVKITLSGHFHRPPKPMDERHQALFALVRAAGQDMGLPVAWQATGGVCDGNNLAAEGVAVIDTMGARGGAIHTPDEFLILDSLAERAGLAAVALMRIAGGQLDGEIGW